MNRGDVDKQSFVQPGLNGAVSDVHLGEVLDHFLRAVFEDEVVEKNFIKRRVLKSVYVKPLCKEVIRVGFDRQMSEWAYYLGAGNSFRVHGREETHPTI